MIFCKHKWSVIEKHEMESQFEISKISSAREFSAPGDFFVRKLIIVLSCEKCGKLNKVVESTGR